MNWLRPLGASVFLIMICLNPAEAFLSAADSLAEWALSVAPSLLPFLIAAPALTSPEVCRLLARLIGPFLQCLRLPANSTGALLIGLLSGSPAGASALSSVPPDDADPPGAYLRASLLASGASPAFLLSGVAVSMLSSPEAGWLLLRSQLISSLLTVLLLRSFASGRPSSPSPAAAHRSAVLQSMLTLLVIGGYMAFFSVLARLIAGLTHPAMETPLLALFELAGGCRALASLPHDHRLILPLISAAACFGGISVYMQCMSFLAPLGVRYAEYAAGKLLHSALSALLTALQLNAPLKRADPMFLSVLCLAAVILLLFLLSRRSHPANVLSSR